MKKLILVITLTLLGFLFANTVIAATTPAVIVIRHAEEGACQFRDIPPDEHGVQTHDYCLTKLGEQHAKLYGLNLDKFITKNNLSPITRVIVIDPWTLVQPGGAFPTTNPYYTIKHYLDLHGIVPKLIPTAPGMNEVVAEKLLGYFKENNTGSTLIVWESKKLDTNVVGTPLLTLLTLPSEMSKLPTLNGGLWTERDSFFVFTNGAIKTVNNKEYVQYHVTAYHEFFDTTTDTVNYKRAYSGSLGDEFGKIDPQTLNSMIFCESSEQLCNDKCECPPK